MPKKISDETKQLMETLYSGGLSIMEVAIKAGVSYATAYGYTKVKQRGFASNSDYQEHLLKQRGFASKSEYRTHLAGQIKGKPTHPELNDLIRQRLIELEKSQKWLSQQLEITEGAVSRYLSGRTTPRRSLQGRLFEVLELPYHTLDDLLESYF